MKFEIEILKKADFYLFYQNPMVVTDFSCSFGHNFITTYFDGTAGFDVQFQSCDILLQVCAIR